MKDHVKEFGQLDILVNNSAMQEICEELQDINLDTVEKTFHLNIIAQFAIVKFALPHLKRGSSIINTGSVAGYMGNPKLCDYSSTKGAISTFTRSLAQQLGPKGIRVNSVAPGIMYVFPIIVCCFKMDTKGGQVTGIANHLLTSKQLDPAAAGDKGQPTRGYGQPWRWYVSIGATGNANRSRRCLCVFGQSAGKLHDGRDDSRHWRHGEPELIESMTEWGQNDDAFKTWKEASNSE